MPLGKIKYSDNAIMIILSFIKGHFFPLSSEIYSKLGTPAVNQILSEPSEGEKERREFGRNKNLERAAETRQASTLIQTRDTRQGAQTMKNHECQHSQKHLSFQNSEGEYGYNHERDEENERDAEQGTGYFSTV